MLLNDQLLVSYSNRL